MLKITHLFLLFYHLFILVFMKSIDRILQLVQYINYCRSVDDVSILVSN